MQPLPRMNQQFNFGQHDPQRCAAAGVFRNQVAKALLRFGCVAVLLANTLSARAQSVEMFMRIGGAATTMGATQTAPTLAGESTDPQYTGWIPVLSMSHGVSRSVTFSGGNPSASTASHSDVALMTTIDKTTPSINLLVNGVTSIVTQPINYVTIDFRKAGSSAQVFYRIEMQGVYFTSAQVSGSTGGGYPNQSLSLTYTKIKWSYQAFDPATGKAQGGVITTGWDVAAQKSF
jgi:type VI secretion system Hcp family effector